MTNAAIQELVTGTLPSAAFDATGEWLAIHTEAAQWKTLAMELRRPPLDFDYLFCLTCVDWKTHFTMVYHLTSTLHRHTVVVKAKVDRNDPKIDTVSDLWKTASFHEREVDDLFGVLFLGHPDLRRLILPDDFEGHPLRKDFEDPINLIKL